MNFTEVDIMFRAIKATSLIAVIGLTFYFSIAANGADWPQWRGPNRDAICTETGLLQSWPKTGPKLLWETTGLGQGFSSVAIVNGKLYTMGDITLGSETAQYVLAYDLTTHKQLWATKIGPPHNDDNGGPRCTPTFDDGMLYAIGTSGDLVCIEAETGKIVWSKHLQKDLGGGDNPRWKFSESPTIDGDKLLCTPGGRRAVMVALNKKTGEQIWSCSMPNIGRNGNDEAGYSSIVITETGGIRQYIQLTNKGLIGVAAEDGRFLWGYNKIANRAANIATPVIDGDYVFCSTAYGAGSALLKLNVADKTVSAEEVYFLDAKTFQNHHGCFVKVGDYIYGGHEQNRGKPTCIEFKTGKIMWQEDQPGGGSAAVLYADGHLYFRYQNKVMALIEANPQGYKIKGRFVTPNRKGIDGPAWAHPVISDGKLYLRHRDVLLVYDVKAE